MSVAKDLFLFVFLSIGGSGGRSVETNRKLRQITQRDGGQAWTAAISTSNT